MNLESEPNPHERFKNFCLIASERPAVINSAFLIQAHFGDRDLEHGSSAKLSIFTMRKLHIQRSSAIDKEGDSAEEIPAGALTHLIVQLYPTEEIEIGIFRLVLLQKGYDYFNFEVHSLVPIDVNKLDGNIYDREVLQELLKPPDSYVFGPATRGDIKRRHKFEIQRAKNKVKAGTAHPAEVAMLKKVGAI